MLNQQRNFRSMLVAFVQTYDQPGSLLLREWFRSGLSGRMPPLDSPPKNSGDWLLSISKHFDLSKLHGRTRCPSQDRIDVWSD
jgi:hypothetical protein